MTGHRGASNILRNMKKLTIPTLMMPFAVQRRVSGLLVTALAGAAALAEPFTPGNLVVERVGDGLVPLTSAATAVFLDEYTTAGALMHSVAMPTTTGSAPTTYQLTDSGVATSDGMLTRSTDGQYLIVSGVATNVGMASAASGAYPRVVGIVKYDGTVDTTTAFTDGFVGNNFRSAASTDGSALWLAGNGGTGNKGARYTTKGSSTTATIDATPNARCVAIYGGNLYYDSQTALYKQTGTPTTAAVPTTLTFSGTAPGSMYQFVFATFVTSRTILQQWVASSSTP